MPRLYAGALTLGMAAAGLSLSAHGATEIAWWHAMGGELGNKVDEIAADFNASQDDYVVEPSFRGNYSETMTGAIAAFRAGEAPAIVQIYEVGTATMMNAEGAIVPVHELMSESGQDVDPGAFLPAVTGYYTDADGRMLSMPFNSSTPVVYVNRDILDEAGVDAVPTTWQGLGETLGRIVDSGAAECGMTTTWPSWIQLENFSARNDLPFATEQNGFGGLEARLSIDDTAAVDHIQRLADWQQDGRFDYGGRFDDAAPAFYTGRCAMLMASSASLAGVRANAEDFDFSVAPLPYDSDLVDTPQNSIIGGASLWVLAGKSDEVYQGVARFFDYLSSAEVQADWHQFSGYLPITQAAYELGQQQGFYEQNPGSAVAIEQMTGVTPTANSKGLRLGNMPQIRDVIEEQLERIFNGDVSAQDGLSEAVRRGNALLERFQQANG
ncbi:MULTISPECIES: sn-glycerol-3-phosphate ABC transporter substrate-binding protein UgpB [Halomonas]|uniref:sn-glycerol-3-phosphate-binding periplasmic protein UgpB n=1 Tax=Halomonas halophila TaxID=29573 RepID=A0ABQ0TZ79_9GAMM|nr:MULTISPECIES: sn-glycerol-3-phosphate ABC transporter substrate-binding protein UgpB [Halomonas]MDR5889689.1 sn-glycerol-3-phosphate ABC transporter substrate-binding protein UgpB [Halomonas salina]WJY06371.1 sn-glycerol-3-phosphate ABC transporter substrate-binding protein UgpB [Halomonas halophila]GEK71542.1 ABC transporter substrate-binding protein [Halomonas halophila]